MLRGGGTLAVAIGALVFGIDALDKPRRTFYRFPNTVDFNNVGSD